MDHYRTRVSAIIPSPNGLAVLKESFLDERKQFIMDQIRGSIFQSVLTTLKNVNSKSGKRERWPFQVQSPITRSGRAGAQWTDWSGRFFYGMVDKMMLSCVFSSLSQKHIAT